MTENRKILDGSDFDGFDKVKYSLLFNFILYAGLSQYLAAVPTYVIGLFSEPDDNLNLTIASFRGRSPLQDSGWKLS